MINIDFLMNTKLKTHHRVNKINQWINVCDVQHIRIRLRYRKNRKLVHLEVQGAAIFTSSHLPLIHLWAASTYIIEMHRQKHNSQWLSQSPLHTKHTKLWRHLYMMSSHWHLCTHCCNQSTSTNDMRNQFVKDGRCPPLETVWLLLSMFSFYIYWTEL